MQTNAQAAPDAELQKSVADVMKSLGMLYKECHALDPSGQTCNAVQQIMMAVSEVAKNLGQSANADPFMQAAQNVNQQMVQSAQPAEQPMMPPPDQGGGY